MNDLERRSPVAPRGRGVAVLAFAAIASDVVVAVLAYTYWRALIGAPSNESLAPEDDIQYALASFAYAVSSVLRYLVLAGLVVALLRMRTVPRSTEPRTVAPAGIRLRPTALAFVAVELVYAASAWNQSEPNGAWFLTRAITCAISALATSVLITPLVPRRGRGSLPRGPSA